MREIGRIAAIATMYNTHKHVQEWIFGSTPRIKLNIFE